MRVDGVVPVWFSKLSQLCFRQHGRAWTQINTTMGRSYKRLFEHCPRCDQPGRRHLDRKVKCWKCFSNFKVRRNQAQEIEAKIKSASLTRLPFFHCRSAITQLLGRRNPWYLASPRPTSTCRSVALARNDSNWIYCAWLLLVASKGPTAAAQTGGNGKGNPGDGVEKAN